MNNREQTRKDWLITAEFDALFPCRETGFESPYDSVELDFDLPIDNGDVLDMESEEPGTGMKMDGQALKRIERARNQILQHLIS